MHVPLLSPAPEAVHVMLVNGRLTSISTKNVAMAMDGLKLKTDYILRAMYSLLHKKSVQATTFIMLITPYRRSGNFRR